MFIIHWIHLLASRLLTERYKVGVRRAHPRRIQHFVYYITRRNNMQDISRRAAAFGAFFFLLFDQKCPPTFVGMTISHGREKKFPDSDGLCAIL